MMVRTGRDNGQRSEKNRCEQCRVTTESGWPEAYHVSAGNEQRRMAPAEKADDALSGV